MNPEFGVQLHLPSYRDAPLSVLLAIAKRAADSGFQQIWVTDNLESRSNCVLLAALASTTEVRLGTAILGQYFRNPIEAATALSSVSELMAGRELTVAVGVGNPFTSRLIDMPRPVGFLRETLQCIAQLVAGERVETDHYPLLARYFNFAPEATFHIGSGSGQLTFLGGGNGPLGLAVAGRHSDGVILGGMSLSAAALNRVEPMMSIVDDAANSAGKVSTPRKIMEVKISVSADHELARKHAGRGALRRTLSLRRRGYSDDDFRILGIDPTAIDQAEAAESSPSAMAGLGHLVSDSMINANFIAGDPDHCLERLYPMVGLAQRLGFEQIVLSDLGPNPEEAITLIANQLIPRLLTQE